MAGEDSVFAKIIRKEIPTEFVYEDDKCVVIKDIAPKAPIHLLVIPKNTKLQRISEANELDAEMIANLLLVAKKVAKLQKLDKGFRLLINDGPEGGQQIYYFHLHILGGRPMTHADV